MAAQEGETDPLDRQCLDALSALNKAMLQLSLYEASHPSVTERLTECAEHLGRAIDSSPPEGLVFAQDRDRWLANGRIIGLAVQVGGPLAALIARFKLDSVTFKPGLSPAELTALCELAATRPDQVTDYKAFLGERGVERVRFNEALYAKVDGLLPPGLSPGTGGGLGEGGGADGLAGAGGAGGDGAGAGGAGSGGGAGAETGAGAAAGAGGPGAGGAGAGAAAAAKAEGAALRARLTGRSLEESLLLLIRQAVKDPEEQRRIYELVVNQLKEELKRKVEEATKVLTQEKKAVLGEQARTETVMSRAGEGVVVVDGRGRVMLMNPAAEEICGARLADAAGKPVTERAGESRVVALASEIELPPDPDKPAEAAVAGAASAQRTIRASWAVVKNEAGRVVGMVMTLTDLAKHRELDRLEREFVAHMTHELRSPLNAIMASLDILEEEIGPELNPDQKKVFSASQLNTRRLEAIVNDVLDYSRLEAGQMSVTPAKVAPADLVDETVRSLKPWADRKGLQFGAALPPDLPPVSAEHRRVVQVLVNLASNSIKFTPKGGTVSVRAAPSRTDPAGMVDFAVLDNGCGIPDADKGKIFQRFMQVGPTANYGAGTGLGLVIAKALVELHGGTLWFESQAGRGTAFYFSLPVWRPPVESAPAKRTPPPAPKPWWKRLLGLD